MTNDDLIALLPLIVVVCWAIVLLIVDLWVPKDKKGITAFLAALGLAAALGLNLPRIDWGHTGIQQYGSGGWFFGFSEFIVHALWSGGYWPCL